MSLARQKHNDAATGKDPFLANLGGQSGETLPRRLKLIPMADGNLNLRIEHYSESEDGHGYWDSETRHEQFGLTTGEAFVEAEEYAPWARTELCAYLGIPEPKESPASVAVQKLENAA